MKRPASTRKKGPRAWLGLVCGEASLEAAGRDALCCSAERSYIIASTFKDDEEPVVRLEVLEVTSGKGGTSS
jgi:hypothetical protein